MMHSPVDLGFAHRFVAGSGPASHLTLLLLHGTGGDADSLLQLGATLYPDATLLSPAGKVMEHGARRFFRRVAVGVFDLDDLRVRTDELAQFVRNAAESYILDPKRIVAVGYSNGANIAANVLLRHPGLLSGAVLFRAMLPDTPNPMPALAGTPVLMCVGEQDTLIPRAATEQLADVLRMAGAELTIRNDPDGHQLSMGDIRAAQRWFVERFTLTP
jgi:predicted esterase